MENRDILIKVKDETLEIYPPDGINIKIPGKSDHTLQLTSSTNEKGSLNKNNDDKNDMTVIDLKDCEKLVRQAYNIDSSIPLIFLKYEKTSALASVKDIQYEVYHPITFERLNLAKCSEKNLDIEMALPLELDEETKKLYNSLKKEGYDLFDKDDDFYLDICTTFTAENGADILLDERIYYFYSRIANISTRPKNCKYFKYNIETSNLICQCKVFDKLIDTEKASDKDLSVYIPKISGYKIYKL